MPPSATAGLLLLGLAAPHSARAQTPTQTLTAGGGIALTIATGPADASLSYSVAVDGAAWLRSGPTAMTAGGVTYTSECATKATCLALSGAPTKTSGTDVSLRSARCLRRAARGPAAPLG